MTEATYQQQQQTPLNTCHFFPSHASTNLIDSTFKIDPEFDCLSPSGLLPHGLSKGACSSLLTVLPASFLCSPIYSPCRPYLTNLSSPLHSVSIHRLDPVPATLSVLYSLLDFASALLSPHRYSIWSFTDSLLKSHILKDLPNHLPLPLPFFLYFSSQY